MRFLTVFVSWKPTLIGSSSIGIRSRSVVSFYLLVSSAFWPCFAASICQFIACLCGLSPCTPLFLKCLGEGRLTPARLQEPCFCYRNGGGGCRFAFCSRLNDVVACRAQRLPVADHVLKLRVLLARLDVMRVRGSHMLPVSQAALAQVLVFAQHLRAPLSVFS
jgi:hypothetical protein